MENKRAKNFENSAKCAYKPIFSYSIKNSISPKMSLTTFLHSADELFPSYFSDFQSPSVVSVNETSIMLQWNGSQPMLIGNPQRNITYYAIEIGSQDGGNQQVVFVPTEDTDVYTITGLQPAITYDIDVYVVIDTEGQGEQTYDLGIPPIIATTRKYSNVCTDLFLNCYI